MCPLRAADESQVQALLRNREPEEVFTEIAAQEDILREQHERAHASDRLEASVRAALAYKHHGRTTAPTASSIHENLKPAAPTT